MTFWHEKSRDVRAATQASRILPCRDPIAAANELERAIRELRFCGAMINGHTHGRYLDDPRYDPFWERVEALAAPIYLHPADPAVPYAALAGHDALTHATWGWGVETGSHALRLIFHGTFARFAKAKLLLGHLGETLPFLLWRFDSRATLYGVQLAKRPSDYIRESIAVTTSGMFAADPLLCTLNALGRRQVMFSTDYPFESVDAAAAFIDNVALDTDVREDICFGNCQAVVGLVKGQKLIGAKVARAKAKRRRPAAPLVALIRRVQSDGRKPERH